MNELQPGLNTGFIEQAPRSTDFMVSGITGIIAEERIANGDWTNYLPTDEMQSGVYFDTKACVTFSALNVLETQLNFLFRNGRIQEGAVKELEELGVLKNGCFNFSDRFTAKMSGTTKDGNYLVKVWDSIRNDGLLAESDWPYPTDQRNPVFDWNDYYKEIPQALRDKAKRLSKIGDILDISYEWLVPGGIATKNQIHEWQKVAPVQIATATCKPWNTTDIIPACGLSVAHATMISNASSPECINIFDQYKPFRKKLVNDYRIPFALRGVVSVKAPTSMPIDPAFGKRLSGKLLLAVEDRGAIWYVTLDGKRVKIGRTPEEVASFLESINQRKVQVTGINNSNLSKIATV